MLVYTMLPLPILHGGYLYSFAFVVFPIELCVYTGASNSSLQSIYVRSSDAKYLAVSSRDGYCTIIEFENEELGQPHILPGISPSIHLSVTLFIFFVGCCILACRKLCSCL